MATTDKISHYLCTTYIGTPEHDTVHSPPVYITWQDTHSQHCNQGIVKIFSFRPGYAWHRTTTSGWPIFPLPRPSCGNASRITHVGISQGCIHIPDRVMHDTGPRSGWWIFHYPLHGRGPVLTIYAPVFYTAPCVKCLMRASALRGVGPGPWFETFFGQNATSEESYCGAVGKALPFGLKVLGSILALLWFLTESKTFLSSILTNLGC
jgi:hypothetical protein